MQSVHHVPELLLIPDADLQVDVHELVRPGPGLDGGNPGIGGGKHGRDIQNQVVPVLADQLQRGGVAVQRVAAPADPDPSPLLPRELPPLLAGIGAVRAVDATP